MNNSIGFLLTIALLINCSFSQVIHSAFTIVSKEKMAEAKTLIAFLSQQSDKYSQEDSKLSVSLEHVLLVEVFIGNPPQRKMIKLGTHPLELWVLNESYLGGYSSSMSSTAKSLLICQEVQTNGGIKGEGFTDDVSLLGLSLANFPFLNVIRGNVDSAVYSGGIGFGYKYEMLNFSTESLVHADFSVLDVLKKKHQIDQRILNVNFNKKTISIGSIYSSFKKKHYRQCNLIQMTHDGKPNPKWECILDSVYFLGDNEKYDSYNPKYIFYYKINSPVTFSLGSNVILGSKDFFDYITQHYLKAEYMSGICTTAAFGKYHIIECQSQVKNFNIPPLSFIIGKWTIKVPFNDLLLDNKVMIAKSNKKNKWIFGFPFLQRYINVFDKEANTFGLYKEY